jgi:hypothetical protein
VTAVDGEKLRPESIVTAGRRPREPSGPLNFPVGVVAPDRHSAELNAYARHDASPTVAAFEAVVGTGGWVGAGVRAGCRELPDGSIFAAQQNRGRFNVRPADLAGTPPRTRRSTAPAFVWFETVGNPLMAVSDVLDRLICAVGAR